MKKILLKSFVSTLILGLVLAIWPRLAFAAGVYPSGGGTVGVGQSFTVNVDAAGATFDSFQGIIAVNGPVSVTSFTPGSATWLPGKTPANNAQFVGITSATSSLRIATIKLKATGTGAGNVSVSGAKLAFEGNLVGEDGGSAGFTVVAAAAKPNLPGAVTVNSTTHPDPNASYEATTIELSWDKPSGVTAYSYLLDQTADTEPPAQVTSSETAVKYENQAVGTHYFHIRGKSASGFGPTTHFQVNIKEPAPQINASLKKPHDIKIAKGKGYEVNLDKGTVKGVLISGITEADFTAKLTLNPAPTLPESKVLEIKADKSGNFSYLIDFPVAAGFYTLTVQGQKEKALTPVSDPVKYELTLSSGGGIKILGQKSGTIMGCVQDNSPISYYCIGASLLLLMLIVILIVKVVKKRRRGRNISENDIDDNHPPSTSPGAPSDDLQNIPPNYPPITPPADTLPDVPPVSSPEVPPDEPTNLPPSTGSGLQ